MMTELKTLHTTDLIADSLLFALMHALVLVAVLVDLTSGWRRAKRLGIARTSRALRRTVSKINTYYSCLLLLSMVDIALYAIDLWERFSLPELPYFCAVGTVLVLIIELRSVYENRSQRDPLYPEEKTLSEQLVRAGETIHAASRYVRSVRQDVERALTDEVVDRGREKGGER